MPHWSQSKFAKVERQSSAVGVTTQAWRELITQQEEQNGPSSMSDA